MSRRLWGVLIPLALLGCDAGAATDLSTGLSGSVSRGPVTPVCQPELACTAPFSAHFAVWKGSHRVASFQSNALGEFTVALAPGDYRVIPGSDAPIIDPSAQVKQVSVSAGAFTVVHLDFDTGIR